MYWAPPNTVYTCTYSVYLMVLPLQMPPFRESPQNPSIHTSQFSPSVLFWQASQMEIFTHELWPLHWQAEDAYHSIICTEENFCQLNIPGQISKNHLSCISSSLYPRQKLMFLGAEKPPSLHSPRPVSDSSLHQPQ